MNPSPAVADVSSEISDRVALLVAKGVQVFDPAALPGLVLRVPAGELPDTAVSIYDTRQTTRRKVNCAFCPPRMLHYEGAVVQFADGGLALMGNCCAKRQFSAADVSNLRRDVELEKRLAIQNDRRQKTVPALQGARRVLYEWEERSHMLVQLLGEVRRTFPDAAALLKQASDKAGPGDPSYLPAYETGRGRTVSAVSVPFAGALRGELPGPLIAEAIAELGRIRTVVTDGSSTLTSVDRAFLRLQDVRRNLMSARDRHRAAISLVSPSWWATFARWANEYPDLPGSFSVKLNRVARTAPAGEFHLPDQPRLADMWAELDNAWPSS